MQQNNGKIFREIPISFLCSSDDAFRERIDPKTLDELCENISRVGIIHPLTVRYCGEGEYEIVSGLRRYLAAGRLGMDRLPCLVTDAGDGEAALISLSENMQRKNLNFFEEAEGMRSVMKLMGLTQEQLAQQLGKSQSSVANKLRLLQLSTDLRDQILNARLSERHARALLSVEGEILRRKVLKATIERGMRVSQMEAYIEKVKADPPARKKSSSGFCKGFCRDLRLYLNSINRTVDLMKNSGFHTHCETSEDVSKIVYRIEIAK